MYVDTRTQDLSPPEVLRGQASRLSDHPPQCLAWRLACSKSSNVIEQREQYITKANENKIHSSQDSFSKYCIREDKDQGNTEQRRMARSCEPSQNEFESCLERG